MNEEQKKSRLIQLAAEMLHCKRMPPEFTCDWDLPPRTPKKTLYHLAEVSEEARKQCKEWSRRIMGIVDAK